MPPTHMILPTQYPIIGAGALQLFGLPFAGYGTRLQMPMNALPVSRRMFKVMEEESTDPPDTVPSSLRTIISGFLVFSQTQNVMYL